MSKEGTNRYGLDTAYIGKNLEILLRDIDQYRPSEMNRALNRLADTCSATTALEQLRTDYE